MTNRIALALLLAGAAAMPVAAQPAPTPTTPEAPAPKDDLVRVALDTAAGRIVIALDRGRAPLTTANFLKYVEGGMLDGVAVQLVTNAVVHGQQRRPPGPHQEQEQAERDGHDRQRHQRQHGSDAEPGIGRRAESHLTTVRPVD